MVTFGALPKVTRCNIDWFQPIKLGTCQAATGASSLATSRAQQMPISHWRCIYQPSIIPPTPSPIRELIVKISFNRNIG
ncbi:hypothetical protein CQ048_18660 [Pseudomonas trivialis]|nr:hypothetical protein CQ048_18660 [Pseudomonas trivialis]PRB24898.1 hypothetical protein CQ041_17795 [Pseudomonas sp. MYb60]